MALSVQCISTETLRNFRYYHYVRTYGRKVVYLVYKYNFLEGQPKKIKDVLLDNGVVLPPARKSAFNDQDVQNFRGNPDELDITLITKICRCLWEKGVRDPGDTLKGLVKKIKDERNGVCHEEYSISQTELENKVNDFQITLEETLDEAKSRLGCLDSEVDQLRKEIRDVVPELLRKIRERYDPSNPDDIQKLQEEIKVFWDQLTNFVLDLTEEELKSLYVRLSKIWPYDWLIQYDATDPCGITVSLKLYEDRELHGDVLGGAFVTVDQNEILKKVDKKEFPTVIIISGDAGSGKTTILCSTLEKWHKNSGDMANLTSFKIVLYVQLRSHSYDNFDDYLRSLLPQTVSLFSLEHIKSSIFRSRCLILCDGFDEVNRKSEKLFEEILGLNCKHFKIVVTTRPVYTEKLTKIVHRAKHQRLNLSLLGLSAQDTESLIGKISGHLLKSDPLQVEEMKRELFLAVNGMDERMSDILKKPLYLNLFILLYTKCPDLREELRSVSALYIQLKKHMSKRLTEKTGLQAESLEEFDEHYLSMSLQNYKKNKYEMSVKDISCLKSALRCQEAIQNFDAIVSSYFTVKHNTEGIDIEKVYCYRHASELEFAAASKICNDIIKSQRLQNENIVESVLLSNGIWNKWTHKTSIFENLLSKINIRSKTVEHEEIRNMFVFITGILYHSEKNILYDIVSDIYRSILKLEGIDRFHSILAPLIETRIDTQILESLTSVLGGTSAKDKITITESKSLSVLPQVLPRLKPELLKITIDKRFGQDFTTLTETLNVTNENGISVHLNLKMDLEGLAGISGSSLFTVDKLDLSIFDFVDDDISRLGPFPITANDLTVHYCGIRLDTPLISQLINTVWPRHERKEASVVRRNEASYFAQILRKTQPQQFQDPSLRLLMHVSDYALDILINSLAVQPLREIDAPFALIQDDKRLARLRKLCKEKGIKELKAVSKLPYKASKGLKSSAPAS